MMDSRDFLREARIMKELRHPNLIQLYAVGIIPKYVFSKKFSTKNVSKNIGVLRLHQNSYGSVALLYALSQNQILQSNMLHIICTLSKAHFT